MTDTTDQDTTEQPVPTAPPRRDRRRLSRRGLLLAGTGVAGVVIGAGVAEVNAQVTQRLADDSTMAAPVPPSEDLMYEHGVLKRVLLTYRAASQQFHDGQTVPADALREGAQIIHDFIESFHEALEETYVFPPLRRANQVTDTVTVLLVQHARGRRITQQLLADTTPQGVADPAVRARITTGLDAFVRMYEPHEAIEDTVVFPAFRALLSEAELRRLGEVFAAEQDTQFGPRGFADTLSRVAEIERAFGIADLNQFTPPA
jgi:hemerythrin-like domain-containing protein